MPPKMEVHETINNAKFCIFSALGTDFGVYNENITDIIQANPPLPFTVNAANLVKKSAKAHSLFYGVVSNGVLEPSPQVWEEFATEDAVLAKMGEKITAYTKDAANKDKALLILMTGAEPDKQLIVVTQTHPAEEKPVVDVNKRPYEMVWVMYSNDQANPYFSKYQYSYKLLSELQQEVAKILHDHAVNKFNDTHIVMHINENGHKYAVGRFAPTLEAYVTSKYISPEG